MRHYLITGGAGFIGSHITQALLNQGATVRVLDDFSTGRMENLDALHRNPTGKLEILTADVRDAAKVREAARGVEVVFHEAAFVSAAQSMKRPQECLDVNITGTSIVLEAARQAGVRRVVVASSAAVYGDSQALPLDEDAVVRPLSPYGVSKAVDEMLSALYTRSFGLEVSALRYFNVYGPRQRPDSPYAAAVPIFIQRLIGRQPATIFGDGRQTRDLIYVGDVVQANLLAADHPAAAGQIFNICTGAATSILELLEGLQQFFPDAQRPVFADVRQGDIYASCGKASKADRVMGFRAQTSLAQGLKATVEWMQ